MCWPPATLGLPVLRRDSRLDIPVLCSRLVIVEAALLVNMKFSVALLLLTACAGSVITQSEFLVLHHALPNAALTMT